MPERDPWGLRALAALLLVTAFAFSTGPYGGTLLDGFRAHGGVPPVPPRIDAWVTPPAYTGRAPMFLTADANRSQSKFEVPRDSEVTVRVTGGSGEETLDFLGADGQAPADRSCRARRLATAAVSVPQSGIRQFAAQAFGRRHAAAELRRPRRCADWSFRVIQDKPPTIRFLDEPSRALNGTLELKYAIEDDYGAVSADAEIAQAGPANPNAHPLYDAPKVPLSAAAPRRRRCGQDQPEPDRAPVGRRRW